MRQLQILALLLLAVAIAYAGFQFTNGFGLRHDDAPRYVINDIYSLITILNEDGECQAAVDRFPGVPGAIRRCVCRQRWRRVLPGPRGSWCPSVL